MKKLQKKINDMKVIHESKTLSNGAIYMALI